MFRRIARNFAKAGYFPTDDLTLERCLGALEPGPGLTCILDPCAGEGAAIAEIAVDLGRDRVRCYAVEYDPDRAAHARRLTDRCLHADLMDTFISAQAFGLLFLNPPYGDLTGGQYGGYEFHGRARLEKLFYQRARPLLQYEGVLIFIIPHYTLDEELVGWLTRHFVDLRVFRALETKFKQVVIFGRRARQRDQTPEQIRVSRARLLKIGKAEIEVDELPQEWPFLPYSIPSSLREPDHFFRNSLEPDQFATEVLRLRGLWPSFDMHLGTSQQSLRPPARALSRWHLALALAAGAISGVVRAKTGRILVVKGDTHKEKAITTEFSESERGDLIESRVLTDRFVPVIRAWDATPSSPTFGQILTIS
jgi:hypothetical protein